MSKFLAPLCLCALLLSVALSAQLAQTPERKRFDPAFPGPFKVENYIPVEPVISEKFGDDVEGLPVIPVLPVLPGSKAEDDAPLDLSEEPPIDHINYDDIIAATENAMQRQNTWLTKARSVKDSIAAQIETEERRLRKNQKKLELTKQAAELQRQREMLRELNRIIKVATVQMKEIEAQLRGVDPKEPLAQLIKRQLDTVTGRVKTLHEKANAAKARIEQLTPTIAPPINSGASAAASASASGADASADADVDTDTDGNEASE